MASSPNAIMRSSTPSWIAVVLAAIALPLGGCTTTDAQDHTFDNLHADLFFATLRNHLGNRYPGRVDPDGTPENPFGDAPLEIEFVIATYEEIHVPFRVGDDQSRTWIIRRSEDGLELRHDHREPDGTPEELTNYGGFSTDDGTSRRQHFPADEYTAKMIPEAKTNIWTLEFLPADREMIYNLTRHDEPRFRAVFDLSRPLRD